MAKFQIHRGDDYLAVLSPKRNKDDTVVYQIQYPSLEDEIRAEKIIKVWNAHADLFAVVKSMAQFDGRNNNKGLKDMAQAALKKLGEV